MLPLPFNISERLLLWYRKHHRKLPWREAPDPYHVWLSEIVLQQTRVVQGLPYYERFVAAFPTLGDLAKSSEEEVLRLWQGLGYYTRARNLHKCARHIVQELGGVFPRDYSTLLALPGIGPYTAAAIASIAFQQPVPTIDGNVYRVLTRIFGIETDILLPATQREITNLAGLLLDKTSPGDYNQALMEFGALHCTPNNPRCTDCIFAQDCVAKQRGIQLLLPVKKRRLTIKHRYFYYLILRSSGQVYLKKRLRKDIWRHLYDFYLIEAEGKSALATLSDPLLHYIHAQKIPILPCGNPYHHQLTHQRIHALFYTLEADEKLVEMMEKMSLRSFSLSQTKKLPMPRLLVNFLRDHPL
ncbi:MAG: A/G-specific adenine glycosylase [Cytophagales bacterium]